VSLVTTCKRLPGSVVWLLQTKVYTLCQASVGKASPFLRHRRPTDDHPSLLKLTLMCLGGGGLTTIKSGPYAK